MIEILSIEAFQVYFRCEGSQTKNAHPASVLRDKSTFSTGIVDRHWWIFGETAEKKGRNYEIGKSCLDGKSEKEG